MHKLITLCPEDYDLRRNCSHLVPAESKTDPTYIKQQSLIVYKINVCDVMLRRVLTIVRAGVAKIP